MRGSWTVATVCVLGLAAGGCSSGAPAPSPSGAPSEPSASRPPPSASPSSEAPPDPTPDPTPGPSTAPDGTAYSTWPLGTRPLPLRADGYGEIRPTPPSLRDRRYRTVDRLPPPSGTAFESSIGTITPAIRRRMGETYQRGCPVGLDDLAYLTVSFRGFDGQAHTGELVVAADVARDVVSVFRTLYRADFPIEEMRLPTTADLDAAPTGDGNNTGAFVCRPTTGQTSGFSAHASGIAIDVNPFDNPYVRGDLVVPERASSYLDRDQVRPGMIVPGDVVTTAFARIGWTWGGDFRSLKDYQHFSADGR